MSSFALRRDTWFNAPVGDLLLELVRKPESEMHRVITFHIRTFADENIGIAFNDDLTLNEELSGETSVTRESTGAENRSHQESCARVS